MIVTKVCTVQEIHCFIPMKDLAQLFFKERFNPNATFDLRVASGQEGPGGVPGVLVVQVDRTEREPQADPPSAFDPEWEKWNQT